MVRIHQGALAESKPRQGFNATAKGSEPVTEGDSEEGAIRWDSLRSVWIRQGRPQLRPETAPGENRPPRPGSGTSPAASRHSGSGDRAGSSRSTATACGSARMSSPLGQGSSGRAGSSSIFSSRHLTAADLVAWGCVVCFGLRPCWPGSHQQRQDYGGAHHRHPQRQDSA